MSDNNVDERKQEGEEQSASASTPSAQSLPQEVIDSLKSVVEEIVSTKIQEQARALQSDKDKRIPRIEKRTDELSAKIDRILALAQQGKDKGQIARELILDSIVERVMGAEPEKADSAPQKTGAGFDMQDIIKKAGLNPADSEVAAALSGVQDPIEAAMRLGVLKAKIETRPSPTPAQSPAPSSQPPKPQNEQALIEELERLSRQPSRNWRRIEEIQKELGWE